MKVQTRSSELLKPIYESNIPPSNAHYIPLSVFDRATYNMNIAVIYVYRPPTPPNATIQQGLQKALTEYREFAGRLGTGDNGDPVILLNDEGINFIEVWVECTLDEKIPLNPSALLSLHPSVEGVDALLQVQLTKFACGSLVVGLTSHHQVADGQGTSNFLVAWGQACRGVEMSPRPLHNRTIFVPREPPLFQFEHRGVEFTDTTLINNKAYPPLSKALVGDLIMHKAHLTLEFLDKLKAEASSSLANGGGKPYSMFESSVAHLWRTVTKVRGISGFERTQIKISVNGRARLRPPVPNEYFGNLVLWALPNARVKDLLREPLSFAAKLIHDAVGKVNDSYFKSFIDFASSHRAEEEGLVPNADADELVMCPNLEVHSWLRFPFYDLDFGEGGPCLFLPSYFPVEGEIFLVPSFTGDGSIDVFLSLFRDNLAYFKQLCYCLH
ncbi:PREDICTED: agmatine coumaroyltransferase-2-like [Nelumbo nucifera]|uniref:Agmatine coumaroyltransferase-2-like n=1 Tax=Nelumbo nucifera TaxID=4432 RepID=A0A1U7ZKM0_NELNU|nr:PREDICTED: agmatine coumaroyltransferase-2-like [Nelumbo nucifera]